MCSRKWLPSGFLLMCQPNGSSAMANDSKRNACPKREQSASSTPIKSEPTVGCCSRHFRLLPLLSGCKRCRLSPPCRASGSNNLNPSSREGDGDKSRFFPQLIVNDPKSEQLLPKRASFCPEE